MRSNGALRGRRRVRAKRLGRLVHPTLRVAGVVAVVALAGCREGTRDFRLSSGAWQQVQERMIAVDAGHPEPPGPPAQSQEAERTRVAMPEALPASLAAQAAAYEAVAPKSILDLQPFRATHSIEIIDRARRGVATLVNLNPAVNEWYVLELQWSGEPAPTTYHLVNADPRRQDLVLDAAFPEGIVIVDSTNRRPCRLWPRAAPESIAEASAAPFAYVRLCEEAVTLRLPTSGRKTAKEKVTDFLRDNVWGGESITALVRGTLYRDAFLEAADLVTEGGLAAGSLGMMGPPPARVEPRHADDLLAPRGLGIATDAGPDGHLVAGQWYRATAADGVFVSAIQPDLIATEILTSHRALVGPLDDVERRALAYLVAFDLDRFDLRFALGTDHPRVGWSDRVPPQARLDTLPGPDGIDSIAPLVATGIIGPAQVDRVVATFTAGFKRAHGAFKYGPLALRQHGSHYGFVESGVTLSKLRPDLATLLVLDDGTVEMKTWEPSDDARRSRVAFARQNGVAIIERDAATGAGVPGALVNSWGPGNWSGSQDGKYRSLRAGACLQRAGTQRFLIYGYFSSATPPAMARVFQAYGCEYAMLLDMNALEHTYLAVYSVRDVELDVEHLIDGMSVLDRDEEGYLLPRFVGYADNRDFFYLLRRSPREDE